MNPRMLLETAQALVGSGRGLLAMDESNNTGSVADFLAPAG
jgi:hypothetical protein